MSILVTTILLSKSFKRLYQWYVYFCFFPRQVSRESYRKLYFYYTFKSPVRFNMLKLSKVNDFRQSQRGQSSMQRWTQLLRRTFWVANYYSGRPACLSILGFVTQGWTTLICRILKEIGSPWASTCTLRLKWEFISSQRNKTIKLDHFWSFVFQIIHKITLFKIIVNVLKNTSDFSDL